MEEKKNELNSKEKKILMIVSLAIVLALVFGISYAYFLAQGQSEVQTITTQNIGLGFDDNTEIVRATNISPIERKDILSKATKKTFTWKPKTKGTYKLLIQAKDSSGKVVKKIVKVTQ